MGTATLLGPTLTAGHVEDLILLGPLSAVSAIITTLAFWGLGQWVAKRLVGQDPATALEKSAGFVFVTAIVAASVHALGLVGWVHLPTLRVVGMLLIIPGLAIAFKEMPGQLRALSIGLRQSLARGNPFDRAGLGLSVAILVVLVIFFFLLLLTVYIKRNKVI